ncbi:hypothetical protein EDB86DRAFT_2835960 [Lactarius hatsudake]|nr:hypothetical protein EDB86DRAFT_2835960 [Lactarius hatsudake]
MVMVAVVVVEWSRSWSHGRRCRFRAADLWLLLCCGCVIVAPWSYHRAVVTPSSHHRSELCEESSCGLHHTACRMRRRVGLALEWWWWLAVRVHVWEWRWWASVELQSSTFNVQRFNVSTTEQLNWYRLARGPPPLLQGKHRRGHTICHTTMPYPLALTPPPRCWALAHYIKYCVTITRIVRIARLFVLAIKPLLRNAPDTRTLRDSRAVRNRVDLEGNEDSRRWSNTEDKE